MKKKSFNCLHLKNVAFLITVAIATSIFTYSSQAYAHTTTSLNQLSTYVGVLSSGSSLSAGDRVQSPNKKYVLTLQDDGNLVLYNTSTSETVWATYTNRSSSLVHTAIMQLDGNFVLYYADNTLAWESSTAGNPGSHLEVQDDGNVVIYTPSHTPVWQSHTANL